MLGRISNSLGKLVIPKFGIGLTGLAHRQSLGILYIRQDYHPPQPSSVRQYSNCRSLKLSSLRFLLTLHILTHNKPHTTEEVRVDWRITDGCVCLSSVTATYPLLPFGYVFCERQNGAAKCICVTIGLAFTTSRPVCLLPTRTTFTQWSVSRRDGTGIQCLEQRPILFSLSPPGRFGFVEASCRQRLTRFTSVNSWSGIRQSRWSRENTHIGLRTATKDPIAYLMEMRLAGSAL